jgi:hypothetical protein
VAPEPVDEPDESFKRIILNGGQYNGVYDYLYFETTPEGRYLYGMVSQGSTTRYADSDQWDVEYDPSNREFHDVGSNNPHTWGVDNTGTNLSDFPTDPNMETQYWYDDNGGLRYQFDNPYYVAPEPVVEPVARIEATGGTWSNDLDYLYLETKDGRYLYGLVNKGTTNIISENYAIQYDPSDGKFHDIGSSAPVKWGQDDIGTHLSEFPTNPNMQTQFLYDDSDTLNFQFDNPYYVEPPPEPDESFKRLVATGGQWNGSFEYLYFETTPEGNFLYGLVEKDSSDRYYPTIYDFEYNPSDGKFHDSGSSHPAKWGIDYNGNGISEFPTTANMETLFWYNDSADTLIFQFTNPYYVAPEEPVVEPVERLVGTGGSWNGYYEYYYFGTISEGLSEGRYLYGMVSKNDKNRNSGMDVWDVEYEPSDGKFYDVGSSAPGKWGQDNSGANTSDFPTSANLETQFWYDDKDRLRFQFDNPYYVAPEPGYRYLAFYGVSGDSNGWFYELELSTTKGLIDYRNPVPLNKITVVAPVLGNNYNNPSCIFDGQFKQAVKH